MKIHNVTQGSPEWLALRCLSVTASELGSLLTDSGTPRDGQMPKTYLHTKLAEQWLGGPIQTFSGGPMEQGTILEDEAIPWIELQLGFTLDRPGFITTDDGSFGCSPDAMRAAIGGYEIKCPGPVNHVKWLLGGACPAEHWLQCQGGMAVTGASVWTFVSYSRDFPKLMVPVQRDEKCIAAIFAAVAVFRSKMAEAWEKLVAANGGEPVRPKAVSEMTSDERANDTAF